VLKHWRSDPCERPRRRRSFPGQEIGMKIGVTYYPEHWPEERWAEDARLMREAGFNMVRLAEFAWVKMEPAEGRFDFPLVFEDHFGGGDRGQAMQVFELCLHLAVPGGLGVEAEIAKGGFHISPVQETLTSTCWGLAFSSFTKCTVSMPSLNSAVTFAGLASSGSEKLRPKLP